MLILWDFYCVGKYFNFIVMLACYNAMCNYEKVIRRCKVKIIIGAGSTSFAGWLSTQENELNILKPKSQKEPCT